ncbi:hypothetical protein BYZ73_03505 [Rhodovulum viride]|uniref:Transposase n=1 Tax=Rhodovulum viride TaxID=1231134 RepID=A0ABX9DKB6_9RHOB|nr:hypothetical protein BYZ73_03505 [Rhodovulum viride]
MRHEHARGQNRNTNRSQASAAAPSRAFWINSKAIAKWRKREMVEDRKTGPKDLRSSVLGETEKAVTGAVLRHSPRPPGGAPQDWPDCTELT